jgi:hypothetical protein
MHERRFDRLVKPKSGRHSGDLAARRWCSISAAAEVILGDQRVVRDGIGRVPGVR